MKYKVFLLLALLILMPMAMAQEDTETETEVEEEVEVMTDNLGAHVRYAQLARAMYANELMMQRVINFVNENEGNSSELIGLQSELTALREDLMATNFDEYTSEETVEKYVQTRRAANNITVEFRTLAREILTDSQRSLLRSARQSPEFRESLSEFHAQVRERIHEYNAERLRRTLERVSQERAREIAQQVRSGALDSYEAAELTREELRTAPEDARLRAAEQARLEEQRALRLRMALAERARMVAGDNSSLRDGGAIMERARALREQALLEREAFLREKEQYQNNTEEVIRDTEEETRDEESSDNTTNTTTTRTDDTSTTDGGTRR